MSCKRCCSVWLRFQDFYVHIGCPHCGRVKRKFEEAEVDLAHRLVASSLEGHDKACPIPVRWVSAKQTTVEGARDSAARSLEQRMEGLRRARR